MRITTAAGYFVAGGAVAVIGTYRNVTGLVWMDKKLIFNGLKQSRFHKHLALAICGFKKGGAYSSSGYPFGWV
ncbi:MAG: hypothetical protein NW218_09840 [Saprospiraceae bacterium]|nr:hypothetical protein [Saprospiraceae bacterium]